MRSQIPDEIIGTGPLKIERYGRHILFSNTSTSEEHAAFLKRAEEENNKIFKELEKIVPELQILISRYDPVQLMHRATYILLPLFMKYKSEGEFTSEESYYLPTVEYIQYLIARTKPNTTSKELSEIDWGELWKKAIYVVRQTGNYIFSRKTFNTPSDEIDEMRFILDSKRLAIRVSRYPIFFFDYLEASLSPYEQWIKDTYGVGTSEIIKGLQEIEEYQKRGALNRYREVMEAETTFSQRLKEKGYAIEPGASPEEIKRTREACISDQFKDDFGALQEKMRLTFTPAIFDITDVTSLPKNILSLLSIKPGESELTTLTGPAPHHEDLSPLSTSQLHYKPFLEVGGRFYISYHSGFEDRIPEIIENDLFRRYPQKIGDMVNRRSDRLEEDSKKLLSGILAPDFGSINLYYPNPDEPRSLTELDGLLQVADILFLVEVKAGGFSAAASRGASKSLVEDLSNLIIEGQRQSERAERYVLSADEVSFFDETGKTVMYKVRKGNIRKIFRIIISREDLGWVGARIAILSVIDPNSSKSYPWYVSIDDLRVVAELFKNDPIRFVHFLELRLRASAETRLSQNDEIEHIGLYNKINHYEDLPIGGTAQMTFDPSYMRDIDYYFMERSAGESPAIPTQEMPPKMKDFIRALKDSQLTPRFEVGSLILSMDAKSRKNFQEQGLNVLDSRLAEGRTMSFRIPFSAGGYGLTITYVPDAGWDRELKISAAHMEKSNCRFWFVVQLENQYPYKIGKIEKILPGMFSDIELEQGRKRVEQIFQNMIDTQKPGRNDKCPCGSNKKYKKCHGR
jgi:hypothetical protein